MNELMPTVSNFFEWQYFPKHEGLLVVTFYWTQANFENFEWKSYYFVKVEKIDGNNTKQHNDLTKRRLLWLEKLHEKCSRELFENSQRYQSFAFLRAGEEGSKGLDSDSPSNGATPKGNPAREAEQRRRTKGIQAKGPDHGAASKHSEQGGQTKRSQTKAIRARKPRQRNRIMAIRAREPDQRR